MSTTTTSLTTTDTTGQPTDLRPWQGSVQASITRTVLDVVETVEFNDGLFTHRNRSVVGASSQAIIVLDDQARRDLLSQLQTQLAAPPGGTDVEALEVFVDLLEASLQTPPSHRFDIARFGPVTLVEATGSVFGHLVLGVDMAGTIHDQGHRLYFEQHLVVLQPGPFRSLSAADRASLANALRANPPADALWHQILTDSDR